MKSKKIILLFLALLVPSIIFVFLKMFGSNQFDIEVFYEEKMPAFTDNCGTSYALPYHVPDSLIGEANARGDSALLIHFGDRVETFVSRVLARYKDDPVKYHGFEKNDAMLKKCIFILEEPFDVALVDNEGRIRGQYNSSERDEVDRLITELAILIRKY